MTALSILLKASLVLLGAAGITRVADRRLSAATRHLIWTLAAAAVLLLPALSMTLPRWTAVSLPAPVMAVPRDAAAVDLSRSVELLAEPGATADTPVVTRPTPGGAEAPTDIAWTTLLTWLYGAGVVVLLVRIAAERLLLQRLAAAASVEQRPEWQALLTACAERLGLRRTVRLLRTSEPTMPMAFGLLRTSVVLPREADDWTPARREAVLLHELAHAARFDCLTQTLAAVACAVYWVHPGVWWMARRLRIERELACDDCVIASGADARDYAGHLLEIAYAFARRRAPMLAVPMAGSRQLEGRLLALLDAARRRSGLASRGRVVAALIMLAVLVPLAAATVSSARQSPPPADSTPAAQDATRTAPVVLPDESDVGTWEIRPARQVGMPAVYLEMRENHSSHGHTVNVSDLTGLSAAQLTATGPVSMTLRRDAGTFRLDGVTRNGIAAGTYLLELDPAFADRLVRRGLARPSLAQQRLLARQNIGERFLDQVTTAGQEQPTLDDIIRAAQHGVDPDFIDGLARVGYRNLSLEQLIGLRNHGVDPEYIDELAAVGFKSLTLEQLLNLRNHGVDPDYVRELAALGFTSLSLNELVNLRNHGVDPDYIREMNGLGFRSLDLAQLINLRNHGVDPDYVSGMNELGYRSLTLDQLVDLRNHGVDPDYVTGLRDLGYTSVPLPRLVELRSRGVDPDYIRELAAAGYSKLTLEQLMELRSRGIDASSIRARR